MIVDHLDSTVSSVIQGHQRSVMRSRESAPNERALGRARGREHDTGDLERLYM